CCAPRQDAPAAQHSSPAAQQSCFATFVLTAVAPVQQGAPAAQHSSPTAQQSAFATFVLTAVVPAQHGSPVAQQSRPAAQQSPVLATFFADPAPCVARSDITKAPDTSTAREATAGAIRLVNMRHSPVRIRLEYAITTATARTVTAHTTVVGRRMS